MNDALASLIPYPLSVQAGAGVLELAACPAVRAAGNGPAHETAQAAAAVALLLATIPWPVPSVQATGNGRADEIRCTVTIDTDLGPEAYRLRIEPDRMLIAAGDVAGAGYATQTLRQLLPADAWRAAPLPGAAAWQLPCAEIADRPALTWRGAHIDVARHFVTKRELLALIDALAALKLNRLHLHLTDDQGWRIESRLHPVLQETGSHRPRSRISLNDERPQLYDDIPHGGYYTLADLAEIAAFAGQRGMSLVPEIDLPGHSTALLAALPELGSGTPPPGGYQVSPDWGIFPNLLAPLPESMRLLRDVFGELIGATGARFVHIGGDECLLDRWRDDPRIEQARRDRGLASAAELHASFLRDVADMLAADFAVRAVVWDEGFASSGGRAGMLRPDTVVMAWRGMQIALQAALAGHDVIAAPVLPTYFDYYQERAASEPVAIGGPVRLEDVASFAPVPPDWPRPARERLVGTQFQVWTEYIPDGRALEYMIFPRACALAEVAWSGGPAGEEPAPPLPDRIGVHLGRLDAAGLEYRPLAGPRPWQQGGAGPRRHRDGYLVQDVALHLDQLADSERP
ncbi:MAG TPA: family 20 glycosylhydrolase [Streptosporangiaceae bacterium]|jgi:hexosaminidase|nr:family 20 glycosylhydrolase [Streptosporangiaceae bacterium]